MAVIRYFFYYTYLQYYFKKQQAYPKRSWRLSHLSKLLNCRMLMSGSRLLRAIYSTSVRVDI